MLLQDVFIFHHLPADLAGHRVLPDALAVHAGQVGFELILRGAELATLVTGLGEGGVVVQPVFLQCVGQSELLTTLLTVQGLLMVLLHVKAVHSVRVVSQITLGAPHDGPVLQVAGLQAGDLLVVSHRVRDGGGEEVSLDMSLQGGVDTEGAGALVALVVPLRHTRPATLLLLAALQQSGTVRVGLVEQLVFLQAFLHAELAGTEGAAHHVPSGAAQPRLVEDVGHPLGLLLLQAQAGDLLRVADLQVVDHAAPLTELLVTNLTPLPPNLPSLTQLFL